MPTNASEWNSVMKLALRATKVLKLGAIRNETSCGVLTIVYHLCTAICGHGSSECRPIVPSEYFLAIGEVLFRKHS